MEIECCAAGIDDADAVVVATDGDNTNIVVASSRRSASRSQCVVVRMLDPARARVLPTRGPAHVLPDVEAIAALTDAVRASDSARPAHRLMYVLMAGGGKVGGTCASLIARKHEVTLIEQRRDRFEPLEQEFEHQVQPGDATELFVLERAGSRAARHSSQRPATTRTTS